MRHIFLALTLAVCTAATAQRLREPDMDTPFMLSDTTPVMLTVNDSTTVQAYRVVNRSRVPSDVAGMSKYQTHIYYLDSNFRLFPINLRLFRLN